MLVRGYAALRTLDAMMVDEFQDWELDEHPNSR
jgi:hypothetical protein